MDYRTRVQFLGLPLVHVAVGGTVDGVYRRGVARGWVAIGDIAFGVLFSAGGIAVGGISVGGVATGVATLGGAALGLASIGGLAIGALALGGAAIGWAGALGGLAVAHDFARGGAAVASHANDPAAVAYFDAHPFFRVAPWVAEHAIVLAFIPGVVALVARVRAGRRSPRADGRGLEG